MLFSAVGTAYIFRDAESDAVAGIGIVGCEGALIACCQTCGDS